MQTHAFALAIVNDLFDEDLDPDLFSDGAKEVLTSLPGARARSAGAARAAAPPTLALAGRAGRRLS